MRVSRCEPSPSHPSVVTRRGSCRRLPGKRGRWWLEACWKGAALCGRTYNQGVVIRPTKAAQPAQAAQP